MLSGAWPGATVPLVAEVEPGWVPPAVPDGPGPEVPVPGTVAVAPGLSVTGIPAEDAVSEPDDVTARITATEPPATVATARAPAAIVPFVFFSIAPG